MGCIGECGGTSWCCHIAVVLRDCRHADRREDRAWVVGGDGGVWAEVRVGGCEHGVVVTVCACVASPWCAHPCASHVAIAQRVRVCVVLSTLCCVCAWLALGCGAC